MLKGWELRAKIIQFGIGKLKPKEMLADELRVLYRLIHRKIEDEISRTI